MAAKNKTIITTILLVMALIQGPYFYYHTSGFIKLILLLPFAAFGLVFSIYLFIRLIKYKNTTSLYHIIGLSCAFIIGILTITNHTMEYLDFNLRKNEREDIIKKIKTNALKSEHINGYTLFPISNDGNDINVAKSGDSIFSVEFYIDRGFIDHASVLLYTNDVDQIKDLESKIVNKDRDTVVKKLTNNWYRVAY